jgi:putative sterol carrier protein
MDETERFFDDLAKRGREPLLKRATATFRFDLSDGKRIDHYAVVVNKGEISVLREPMNADCTVKTDRDLFNAIVSGQQNAMAAALRGALTLEGDPQLLVTFQRLFGSAKEFAHDGREPVGSGRRQR